MADSEKKKRSGRAREAEAEPSEAKPKKKPAAGATEPEEKLLKPWGPLIWLLIPLFACVAYGLATRGH